MSNQQRGGEKGEMRENLKELLNKSISGRETNLKKI
jgi:hypothetical protein